MSELNVLMQCSDYYAPFCGVALQSLLQNNEEIGYINIYLISDNISKDNLIKFHDMIHKFKRNLSVIDGSIIEKILVSAKVPKYHESYTTYYKLFSLQLIEENIEKLLYLDSDIIINGSLKELVELDMKNYTLAMTLDWMNETYKKILHIVGNYYNGGVILFNLRKWHSEKWNERILQHLKCTKSNYFYADQDLLNILINKDILRLDMKWNLNTDFLNLNQYELMKKAYDLKIYYDKKEFENTINNPIIYHFCFGATVSRPWFLYSRHPLEKIWDKYLLESPWKGYTKERERMSLLHKAQRVLYNFLPLHVFAEMNNICTKLLLLTRQLRS